MDKRLEAVSVGMLELAKAFEKGSRLDAAQVAATLRQWGGLVRAAAADQERYTAPNPAIAGALAQAIQALSHNPQWSDATKNLIDCLMSLALPPVIMTSSEPPAAGSAS